MKSLKKTVVALAASTIGTVMIAGSVSAATETKVIADSLNSKQSSQHVNFADLKTSSDAGMAALVRRIERAAESVCGSSEYHKAGSVSQAKRNEQCQEDAIAAALSRLADNKVASVY
jgi:UrcA family protein